MHRPAFVCALYTGVHDPYVTSGALVETVSHSMFTLAMQSGAFLHLVVTLTALVARLAHLSSALRHVLSALHAESIRLLDTVHVRTESSTHRHSAPTPIIFKPAEAMHNAPLPPPPPLLDSEDAETSSVAPVSTGRIVPDSDLDMSTDLGEAVAHPPTLTLTPQPKSRLTTPMALDIPFPTHDASVVPIPRQPG